MKLVYRNLLTFKTPSWIPIVKLVHQRNYSDLVHTYQEQFIIFVKIDKTKYNGI